ncbi:hypothetical protein ASC77_17505 [Nocardioides sp. Root1257]|uniref:DUF5667 domain-containing protein n=1 Tax=unclassified Nocardioides TaxID=2615069 RepID=UPI0006FBE9DE|nr:MULTISPECIES: DUF5667 domain-containing protein [unclassified Nocardioides]KQW46984.1 hypothetical protein ASC77_17505 [Nocardioides sp. Root1257]KRC43731.1 hypothetical protein ASE24_18460 [Nocardioides sp. Root224]
MTWGPRAQRRADDFDTLVEQLSTGQTYDAGAARDAELLQLVGALRSVPDPQPRPEFVADLRTRLMTEAETALVPTDVSRLQLPARRTTRERRIAAVVGGLALVGATTSVAMAAQSALPGESLYPIKRVLESAHTSLSLGEARKGSTELANASSRLDEATALTQAGDSSDDEQIARTLSTFTDQATSGADLLFADYAHTGREASIAELHDFASSSMTQLAALEPQIPYGARDELIAAASTIAQIDSEATLQCPTCGGTVIESIPPTLVAAEQVALPTPPAAQSTGQKAGKPGRSGTQGSTSTDEGDPQLPVVGDDVPPGSVLDPSTAPSTSPNPIKDLTDGLTGVLTGKGSTGTSGGSGSSPSSSPLGQVVGGVGEILQGVVDPVTGLLVPSSTAKP